MPITLHVDLLGHSFTAYFLAYQGKLNPYDTLLSLPASHPLVRNYGVGDIFIYPPLTYFTLGFFRILIKPFTDPNFLPFLMEFPARIHERHDLFFNLFLYKLPYLFIDTGIAFLLAGLFKDLKEKRLAFAFWMFNPVTLYATFMVGQVDILAVFFSVLALYFLNKDRYVWMFISLGLGGSYKMYPLLFILPAAFVLGKNFVEKIKYVVFGFAPFLLTILPYLMSSAFRYMVFSPKSQKELYMAWNLSGAEGIYPFILVLFIIYFVAYYSKKKYHLGYYFLSILLLIYSVTHYHPQWFLWVTPFFVWSLVKNKLKYWEIVFILFIIWVFITLMFESSLSIGLFNPIYPALTNLPSLADVLNRYVNIFQYKSVARSIFASASLFYSIILFRDFDNN